MLSQGLGLVGLAATRHAHHQPEATRPAGLHADQRVLDHHRPPGRNAEPAGRSQEGIGRGLALQLEVGRHPTVEPQLKQVGHMGRLQDRRAVAARRHHGRFQAPAAHRPHTAQRVRVGLDPVCGKNGLDQLILAVAQSAHRPTLGRIVRGTVGQRQAARGEKTLDALIARLAVNVARVISADIEGHENAAVAARLLPEKLVEHAFPARGMKFCGCREDSIEVEQHGLKAFRCH